MKKLKRIITVLLVTITFYMNGVCACAVEVSAPSVVLMEASSGKVIYEKDAYTKRSPASVTKVMTLLLVFEELEKGNVKLDDLVTTVLMRNLWAGLRFIWKKGSTRP